MPQVFIQFSALSIVAIFALLFSCKKDDGEEENSISEKYAYTHIALLDFDKNYFL